MEATELAGPGEQGQVLAAAPGDAVGFGKHGGMTYEEAWINEPQYCMWVMTTFKQQVKEGSEEESPWKEGERMMKRFAQWVTEKERVCLADGPAYEYNDEMELVEVLATRSLKDRVGQQEKKQKFYGVAKPQKRICTSWEECKQYVHGVKGVVYRSFATREEAEEFVNNPPLAVTKTRKQPPTEESNGEAKKNKKTKKNQQSREDSAGDEEPQQPAKKRRSTRTKSTAEVPENSDAKSEKESNEEDIAATAEVPKGKKKGLLALAKAKAKADAKAKAKVKAKAEAKGTGKTTSEEKPQSPAKGEAKASAKAKAKAKTPKAKVLQPVSSADASPESPAAAAAAAAPAAHGISEQVLMAADSCGLRTALRNLASRPEIEALKLDGHCLLHTLKECEGLVNKAKAQLLENGPSTPPKSQNADAQVETPEKLQVPKAPVPDRESNGLADDKQMEIDPAEARQIQAADVRPPVPQAVPDGNCCPNCDTPFAESGSFCRCCGMARRKKASSTAPQVAQAALLSSATKVSKELQEKIQANRERALARKRQAMTAGAGA
ncbi:unnamed protein product [Cladocopium goreaui]|uniref:Ribonuclease H1 N-terminal domain-containing protein n=1 Tax=Cladocopium goreaui TaxID=2562237 RepID=A0A9P1BQD7_9DINO|nr:unnamed protein product [Cladocopium goreaui]